MKFSIIYVEPYSGEKAKVYTIKYEGKKFSELQSFIYKFQDSHSEVVKEIVQRIITISQRNGIQSSFFRRESPESHNVFRLLETKDLRIYCIMFNNVILLFGSGGIKKHKSRKLSQNPSLQKEVNALMKIEDAVKKEIGSGAINLSSKGLIGDLNNLDL